MLFTNVIDLNVGVKTLQIPISFLFNHKETKKNDHSIYFSKFEGNFFFMKKQVFKILAKTNKLILPSFTKKRLDISKASVLQLAIIGWRAYVTKNSLD